MSVPTMTNVKKEEWVVDVGNQLAAQTQSGDADPAAAEAKRWRKHSIYRVPEHVNNYSPRGPEVVSLGPFHHDTSDHLNKMEEHKGRALLHVLRRAGARRPFGDLVDSVEAVAGKLQEAYKDLEDKWSHVKKDRFVKMMVMDGCFLLEVMRTAELDGEVDDDYAANDPVFSRHGELYVFPYVRRDMLMIENQLPLLVLKKILAFVHGHDDPRASDDAINNMVLKFVTMTPDPPPAEMVGGGLALHALDVCHRSLLDGVSREACKGPRDEFVPSATELHQAGVRFGRSATRSLRDIRFVRGELRIPHLAIEDTTESKLFSLMAFEQLHTNGAGANEVTAYVFFMDNIIKSGDDARLLGAEGVISNGLGSDEAVAGMFNRLANEAVLDRRSALHDVHREVNAYRAREWNKWQATFARNHLKDPWAILSLVAAVFLLVLTVVQTVYGVLPYYQESPRMAAGGRALRLLPLPDL